MNFDWAEFFQIFLTTWILPKVGVGAALLYGFSYFETLICAGGSCIFASLIFTYVFDGAIKWYQNYVTHKFPSKNKSRKIFTRKTRMIISAKKKFGIIGIAFISPLFLSIPLGSFLAIRFFNERKKTFFWLSIFSIFWVTVFYFFMNLITSLFQ